MSSRSVLFLIHGMGNQKAGWEQPVAQAIQQAFDSPDYPKMRDLGKFDDLYQTVPLSYNEIFDRYREQWQQGPNEILDFIAADDSFKAALAASPDQAVKVGQIEKAINTLTEEGDFFWENLLDVILYRFHLLVRSEVNVSVARQLLDALEAADGVNTEFSIVAHSLGTSVIHNVLHALYETDIHHSLHDSTIGESEDKKKWPDSKLKVATTRPQVLAMVSNVSRLLQLPHDSLKVYNTLVRPGAESEGAICIRYLNVNHKYDPFPRFRPYEPDLIGGFLSPFGSSRTHDVSPEIIRHINVHDFEHYMRDPTVHVALFRALYRRNLITKRQLEQALIKHHEGGLQELLNEARDALNDLKPAPTEGIGRFLESFIGFARLIRP